MLFNDKVLDLFDLETAVGDYGVEVEVEGDDLPHHVPGFIREEDGSLRGESAEYVFDGPVSKPSAIRRLKVLEDCYKLNNSVIKNSYRCSVHVHMNVQQFNMAQVANLFVLYATFEEYLVKYCGSHREGNLFCLRLADAEFTVQAFIKALKSREVEQLSSDNLRYSAINLAALGKYGSMEFRAMGGTDDINDVINWIELLDCLKRAALRYATPVEILEQTSKLGSRQLAESVFGELLDLLPLEGNWEDVMFENMRMIQDIAYQPTYLEEELIHE